MSTLSERRRRGYLAEYAFYAALCLLNVIGASWMVAIGSAPYALANIVSMTFLGWIWRGAVRRNRRHEAYMSRTDHLIERRPR